MRQGSSRGVFISERDPKKGKVRGRLACSNHLYVVAPCCGASLFNPTLWGFRQIQPTYPVRT